MKLCANAGTADRIIRVVLGLALIAWVLFMEGPVWAWIGLVPLATGVIGICPLYSMIGMNTCAAKTESCATKTES